MKKKILVTGSAGFIFSNFVRSILYKKNGFTIVSIDKIANRYSLNNIYANKGHEFYIGDVSDQHFIDLIFQIERPDIVVHGAAESVKGDTIIPYMAAKKIEHVEIQKLWDRFYKHHKENYFINNNGVEVINLYGEQQRALTIKNGIGQWRKIKQISRHKYNGKMIHMRQKWGEIDVTPNHSIYDSDMNLTAPNKNVELLSLRYIQPSHSLKNKISNFGGYKWKTDVDDFLYLIAFFITEGWCCYNKTNGGYQVGFAQNERNDLYRLQKILLDNFNIKSYLYLKKKCGVLSFANKHIFKLLKKECGTGSCNKKIPPIIFKLNKDLKKRFIEYMVYFDGHKYTDTNKKYCTNSRHMAAQLSTLLSMIGQQYLYGKKIFDNNWNDSYTFQLSDTYNKLNKSIYLEYNYNGWVYDLEIDDTHKFVCGLGNVIVHNSHVDESVQGAIPFIKSNVLGTQVIVDACIKYNIDKMLYVSCYDDKTKIVTREGLKSYSDLKIGDLVLTLNHKTKEVEEKPIEKIVVQDYNGEMLHFNNRRLDLKVTSNHKLLYTNEPTKHFSDIKYDTAEKIERKTSKNYIPNGSINKESVETIFIEGIGNVDAYSLFYLSGVFIGDGFTAYQEKKSLNKSGLKKCDYIKKCRDPDTGQFIKSKNIGDEKYTISHSYRVFIDVPIMDKARKPLEKALKKLGINFTSQKNKSGEHIYFSSKHWLEYFKQFGKHAKNKHIPLWMFDHGTELLKVLWRGIHDSDGHGFLIKGSNTSISSVSELLKEQLCYLGSMLGYFSKFEKRHNESYIDDREISGECNVIYFSNKRRILIPKPKRVPYNGKVWCLTVKDNHNFLIERNGYTVFCGNSDEVYGQLENENEQPWTEESIINPRNPYSASKMSGELIVKAANITHGLQYNITRSCNNFGPRQSIRNLIPKIIKCIINNEKMPIYGKGKQVREWIHVFDNCEAILKVLSDGKPNETYNISTNWEISNIEMFTKICDAFGKGHDLVNFIPDPRPGHDFRYSIDSSKIRALGWSPKLKFIEAVKQTCQWYLNNKWMLK